MAYRTVTFRSVLLAVALRLGLDANAELQTNQAEALTEYINTRLRIGWKSHQFPDLCLVETRSVPSTNAVAFSTTIDTVEQVYYVDPTKFQFPRERRFWQNGQILQLDPAHPAAVWVRYLPQCPIFTAADGLTNAALLPYVLAEYVKESVRSDALREDGQEDKAGLSEKLASLYLAQEQADVPAKIAVVSRQAVAA